MSIIEDDAGGILILKIEERNAASAFNEEALCHEGKGASCYGISC